MYTRWRGRGLADWASLAGALGTGHWALMGGQWALCAGLRIERSAAAVGVVWEVTQGGGHRPLYI